MGAIDRLKEVARKATTPAVLAGIGNFGGLYDAAFLQERRRAGAGRLDGRGGHQDKDRVGDGRATRAWATTLSTTASTTSWCRARGPLFFLDYIASSRLDPDMLVELVDGCAEACAAAGCALLGRRDGRDAGRLCAGRV